MSHLAVPACYYPTTALFVDDSREFLINFTLQLDESLSYEIYDSPYHALDAVVARRSAAIEKSYVGEQKAKNNAVLDLSKQIVADNCLQLICAEIYNPLRFTELSVVVADYAMPGMNGFTFCDHLNNEYTQKILLTGQVDEKKVIAAFNQGSIHRYFRKNNPCIVAEVSDEISTLQQHYFQVLSDVLIKILPIEEPQCMSDSRFLAFFKTLRDQHNICEFYLLNQAGSFLLVDTAGNTSALLVQSTENRQQCLEAIQCLEFPEHLRQQVDAGELLLYLVDKDLHQSIPPDWSQRVFSAKQFTGERAYHYAYVEDTQFLGIDTEVITSYNHYLEQRELSDIFALCQ